MREEKLQNTQVVFMIVRCVCMLCLLLLHKFSEIMKYNVCTSWQQSQPENEALSVGVFRYMLPSRSKCAGISVE